MLGVNKGKVKLAAYSNQWNAIFLHEKALLEKIIGKHVVDMQHIGSTAISNISAKPIIDILIGVDSMDDVKSFDRHQLADENIYRLKVVLDGKVVFAKFSDLESLTKTHTMHVVEYKGDWWNQHVFFRDYLNQNPEVATEYEELKQELASVYANDEVTYTDKKKKFVDAILARR